MSDEELTAVSPKDDVNVDPPDDNFPSIEDEGTEHEKENSPRIRLCSTIEDPDLPYDDNLQPPAIEFWESLLLSESSTIRSFLHKKRSDPPNVDAEDIVAWDRLVSHKVPFFPEERVIYLDELIMYAASPAGAFLGVGKEAKDIFMFTDMQIWQGVHTWMDWITGDKTQLHPGRREDALSIGRFLGARAEYLNGASRSFVPVELKVSAFEDLDDDFAEACTLSTAEAVPEVFFQDPEATQAGQSSEKPNIVEDTQLSELPAKPRVRIYITPLIPDLPFNDPRQPLYFDVPEQIACKHSSLIRQALTKKRAKSSNFDPDDEIVWDPAISKSLSEFPTDYPVLILEEIIHNLCDPALEKKRWIRGVERIDCMNYVKQLLASNVGEVWDALKTWFGWILERNIVLFPSEKALKNAAKVGIFLGATETYLEALERHYSEQGGASEPSTARNVTSMPSSISATRHSRSIKAKSKKTTGAEPKEPETFEETDAHIVRDLANEAINDRPDPQPLPISGLRTVVHTESGGLDEEHGFYKRLFGKEGGPLNETRPHDCNQIIEDEFVEKNTVRGRK